MKRATKLIGLLLAAAILMAGCRAQTAQETTTAAATAAAETTTSETSAPETLAEPSAEKQAVTILYTNDIHSFIFNTEKDADGNEKPGLRLSKITAYKDQLEAEGKNVLLVDCGDEIQGNIYGAYDQGETIISLMGAAGYQLAAVGNHEFDYGISRLLELRDKAAYPFLSCTFRDAEGNLLFDSTKIIETGGVKIGFVGATTPSTITSSTPTFFQNDDGEYIYFFDGNENAEDLYTSVQTAVDSIRDEVDYVIVLGHLGSGMDEKGPEISSYDVIEHTSGIDVLLDGHSHTTMEKELVKDRDGHEVLLTQTGCYLKALGQLEISADGQFDSRLITEGLEEADETLAAAEEAYNAAIEAALGQKAATLEKTLYISDAEDESRRLVRARETNLGDFSSDCVYWFFNEEKEIPCDIVLNNGGSLRANLKAGDISFMDVKTVRPFNNQICLIRATGQQVLDALEMGARLIGQWDSEWNTPAENGGFMQVAGLKYTIDAAIPSGVVLDTNGMFLEVSGQRRVCDVSVYNRSIGQYEPLDPEKTYTVGGVNYVLRSSGDGFSMFADAPAVVDFVGTDASVMMDYVLSFAKKDGYPDVATENSPLKGYVNYLMDYEDPTGAGRITLLNIEE